VRRKLIFVLLVTALPACISAQSASQQKANHDQQGTTCAQILKMSSSDWIAKVMDADASAVDAQIREITSYGRCYDARTDRLAASLAKTGKGPSVDARNDFRDFEAAITDFTAKGLAPGVLPADPVKSAYAALYEKQFRYAFYQSFEPKSPTAPGAAKKPVTPAAAAPTPAPAKLFAPAVSNAPAEEPKDVDEMTLAKNRFGELLRAMPDDRLHEIHQAFGEILGADSVNHATQLAVYRYAIFVLESPSDKPFSPPPF
jgi:hypothetical protein